MSRYSVAMGVAGMLTVMTTSMLVWLLATEPVALATAVDDYHAKVLQERTAPSSMA